MRIINFLVLRCNKNIKYLGVLPCNGFCLAFLTTKIVARVYTIHVDRNVNQFAFKPKIKGINHIPINVQAYIKRK